MSTGLQQLKALRIKPTAVETPPVTTEEIYSNIGYYLDKLDSTTEAYYQTLELSKRVSTESNDYKIILEGFIGSIVDAIKAAINWVIKLIKDFISWVGGLFGGKKGDSKDGESSPSDKEVTEAIETIKKAKNKSPESDPLKKHNALYNKYVEHEGVYKILASAELKYTLLVPVLEYNRDHVDSVICEKPEDVYSACIKVVANLHNITKGVSFSVSDTDAKFSSSFRKYHKEDKPGIYGRVFTNTYTTTVQSNNGVLIFGETTKAPDDVGVNVVKVVDESVSGLLLVADTASKLTAIDRIDNMNKPMQADLKSIEKQLTTLLADIEANLVATGTEPSEQRTKIMNVKSLTETIIKVLGHQINDNTFKLRNSDALRKTIVKISKLPGVEL